MAEKLKVKVERSKWLRGPEVMSLLLDLKGRMCCLGFAMKCEGFDDPPLCGNGTPAAVFRDGKCSRLVGEDGFSTHWASTAMTINDAGGMGDPEREELLLEHCARDDSPFQFEFVD